MDQFSVRDKKMYKPETHLKIVRQRPDSSGVTVIVRTDAVPYMANRYLRTGVKCDGCDRVRQTGTVRTAGAGDNHARNFRATEGGSHDSMYPLGQAVRGLCAVWHRRCLCLARGKNGADGGIRTCDIGLMSPPLCH